MRGAYGHTCDIVRVDTRLVEHLLDDIVDAITGVLRGTGFFPRNNASSRTSGFRKIQDDAICVGPALPVSMRSHTC